MQFWRAFRRTNRKRADDEHSALYESPVVYYSFVFSLPDNENVYALVDSLLKYDLGDAAVASGSESVRFSGRHKYAKGARKLAVAAGELIDVLQGKKKFREWVMVHPGAAFYFLRKRMIKVSYSFSRGSAGEPDAEAIEALREFKSVTEKLDSDITDVGLMVGSLAAVDRKMFIPGYLTGEPFVRIELEMLIANSDVLGSDEIVPMLLLHRSGIAVLSFAAIPGSKLGTDDLLAVSASGSVTFGSTTFPSNFGALIEVDQDEVEKDEWVADADGEMRRQVKWNKSLSLQDLFRGYLEVITQLCTNSTGYPEWMCYTTVFVDGFHCCGSRGEWVAKHSQELAGLIYLYPPYRDLKASVVEASLVDPVEVSDRFSTYFGAGNMLAVEWQFFDIETSSPVNHFSKVAVVENVLLQYWQMRRLDYRLSANRWTLAYLTRIQREVTGELDEYRSTKFAHLGARKVANEIASNFELSRLYSHIMDRLGAIQQLLSTRATEIANRRNFLIAGAGALAAVFLGIPAIKEMLQIVGQVEDSGIGGLIAKPLRPLVEQGSYGVWVSYLVVVSVTVIIITVGVVKRLKESRKKLVRNFGVDWDADITYVLKSSKFGDGKHVPNADE